MTSRSGTRTADRRPCPRLVHTPSEPSGSQRSPAVGRSRRSQTRSCGNRPGGRTLRKMRSQVQVLAGPPPIPPAHGHPGRSSTPALPARPTGSCHPRATTSGSRVLRTGGRRLDQLVQASRDGGVPPSHDVLVTQRSGGGGMPHPDHQLPSAGARRHRQSRRRVPQVMEAQSLYAGRSGSRDPDPAGEVAAADRATPRDPRTPARPGRPRHRCSGAWPAPRPPPLAGSPSAARRRSWSAQRPAGPRPPGAARPP
jgi:hypothetical protein